jgi:hypothetical protein
LIVEMPSRTKIASWPPLFTPPVNLFGERIWLMPLNQILLQPRTLGVGMGHGWHASSAPGSSWENFFIESRNARVRDALKIITPPAKARSN